MEVKSNDSKSVSEFDVEQDEPKRPFVLWFTGLSGAGKSTLAAAINAQLIQNHKRTYLLDGDKLRQGLCSDLMFSDADRIENIRRVSELTKILLDSGCIVLAALISPRESHRQQVRNTLKQNGFIEVFVDASFEECERRDIKGLYKKARAGKLTNFTGIDSDYEVPSSPDIHIRTESQSLDDSVKQIMRYLNSHDYIKHG